MEEAGSGHEFSHNATNVGCLAGFVYWVTLGCQCPYGYSR
jgi:hypothetical protein